MRKGYYMHPASHYGNPTSTADYAPTYGTRWRLKESFNMSLYSAESQVILKALQKYGMFLSDGGSVALTGMSDHYSNSGITWDDVGLGSRDIEEVTPNDFEVMNGYGSDWLKGYYDGWPNCIKNDIPINPDLQLDCNSSIDDIDSGDVSTTVGTTNGGSDTSDESDSDGAFTIIIDVYQSDNGEFYNKEILRVPSYNDGDNISVNINELSVGSFLLTVTSANSIGGSINSATVDGILITDGKCVCNSMMIGWIFYFSFSNLKHNCYYDNQYY